MCKNLVSQSIDHKNIEIVCKTQLGLLQPEEI